MSWARGPAAFVVMRFPYLFTLASLFVGVVSAALGAPASERVDASFLLALGRPATAAEQAAWQARADQSLTELLAAQRARLQADEGEQQAVAERAWRDAYGRAPSGGKPAAGLTYVEQLQAAIVRLATQPDEYREVVERVYRAVIGRAAYPEEHEYWRAYPVQSYAALAGCVENWARRNAPGLMVTSGVAAISVTSDQLRTRWLSPAVAAEAREALQLPTDAVSTARGCAVLMPGAGSLVSVGGVAFLAVGGDALRAR